MTDEDKMDRLIEVIIDLTKAIRDDSEFKREGLELERKRQPFFETIIAEMKKEPEDDTKEKPNMDNYV